MPPTGGPGPMVSGRWEDGFSCYRRTADAGADHHLAVHRPGTESSVMEDPGRLSLCGGV